MWCLRPTQLDVLTLAYCVYGLPFSRASVKCSSVCEFQSLFRFWPPKPDSFYNRITKQASAGYKIVKIKVETNFGLIRQVGGKATCYKMMATGAVDQFAAPAARTRPQSVQCTHPTVRWLGAPSGH